MDPAAVKATEKLQKDSAAYIHKNKDYIKYCDTYDHEISDIKSILSKRTLVAQKLINKIQLQITSQDYKHKKYYYFDMRYNLNNTNNYDIFYNPENESSDIPYSDLIDTMPKNWQ